MPFVGNSLPKLHEPAPSSVILQPLYNYLLLSLFFNSNYLNHRQCKHLQIKRYYRICDLILPPKYFLIVVRFFNGLSSKLYIPAETCYSFFTFLKPM